MDQGLATVIGMSIAYVASFLGMAFAWVGWRKRQDGGTAQHTARDSDRSGDA